MSDPVWRIDRSPRRPPHWAPAVSAPIGVPHRWLNIVGVADFDGDGVKEIALVATPHIGGTLTVCVPDMVIPDDRRTTLVLLTIAGGE